MPISLPPSPIPMVTARAGPVGRTTRPVAAEHEQLVDGPVPGRHRCAARVEIVALAAAAWALDGDHVGRALAAQQGGGHAVPVRIGEDISRRPQDGQGRPQNGHSHGIGHVAHAGAQPPERMAEHRRPWRAVGLGGPGGHRETGRHQHAAGSEQSARGSRGAAQREEPGDAAAPGVEREEMVDRIPGERHPRESTRGPGDGRHRDPPAAREGRAPLAKDSASGSATTTPELVSPRALAPGAVLRSNCAG